MHNTATQGRSWFAFNIFLPVLVFCLVLFPTVYRISCEPIELWDEARHIGSSYEMLFRHDYIVNYWQNTQDYWNLKPTLSFLPIALSLKIFGKSLLAARLPSLLCFVVTLISLYHALWRRFSGATGLYAVLVFSVWSQNVLIHSFRHADADALFCTLFLACILLCLHRTQRAFCLACGVAALCFLSKSWHCLTLLPPLFLTYLLTKPSLTLLFKGSVSFSGPILLWAGLRVRQDGWRFLHDMVWYDLLKRSGQQIEGHHNPAFFYFSCFVHDYPALLWQMLVLVGFALLALLVKACRAPAFRSHIQHHFIADIAVLGLAVCSVFGLFSAAQTRLPWYTYPAYPLLCVLMAYGFAFIRPCFRIVAMGLAVLVFGATFPRTLQRENAMQLPLFDHQLQAATYLPIQHIWKDGSTPQNEYAALLTYLPVFPTDITVEGADTLAPRTLVIRPSSGAGLCTGCFLVSKGEQYDLLYRP